MAWSVESSGEKGKLGYEQEEVQRGSKCYGKNLTTDLSKGS
jgi:hypothetical protein